MIYSFKQHIQIIITDMTNDANNIFFNIIYYEYEQIKQQQQYQFLAKKIMLSLDSLKTRTIYSKYEINSLYLQFKNRLNEAYAEQSTQAIENVLGIIKLIYYLSDVPSLLKQLNQLGEIQMLSTLEILFMKSSQWKGYKQIVQKWVSCLMKKISQFATNYQIKPQILAIEYFPQKQTTNIQFYAYFLQKTSKQKNHQAMMVSICFLRVFLIDQIQNKRKKFVLTQANKILNYWKIINQGLIKISSHLQNLKLEQICISICYWLCSQNKQFILQCARNGAITFLCQTLSNKNISEWYGRKILSFLKLLLLGLDQKRQYEFTDIEQCIAQFTLQHDNQQILQQARSLFACMRTSQTKIQNQKLSYQKYTQQKTAKNLQKIIKDLRVLLLYSQDQLVKNQLTNITNIQYFYKVTKKQTNINILSQIFNIIAYNNLSKDDTNPNLKQKYDHDSMIVQRVSSLLTDSVYKNDFLANGKKILITLIRMFKEMIQNRKQSDYNRIIEKIKKQAITKKFGKYADCTNFQYERQLLSLIRLINSPTRNLKQKSSQNQSTQHQSQSLQLMKNLVKYINSVTPNQKKSTRTKLQDQYQQLQILYELLQRGQAQNINKQILSNLIKKIRIKKQQKQQIQITILDQSQQQRSRQLFNKINHLVVLSLIKIQKQNMRILSSSADQQQNSQNINNNNIGYVQYKVTDQDINKLINLALTTQDKQTLKAVTQYLYILFTSNNQRVFDHTKYRSKLQEIYNKYKQKLGEDLQLDFNFKANNNNGSSHKKQTQSSEKNKKQSQQKHQQSKNINNNISQQLFQKCFNGNLSVEQLALMQKILYEEDKQVIKKYLENYSKNISKLAEKQNISQSSLTLFLKFILKLSKIDQNKIDIYQKFSKFLAKQIPKCSDTNQNLIYKIYTQLYQENVNLKQNAQFFKNQLHKSYEYFSKDSIQFTSYCLANFQYTAPNSRRDQYWKYIYNAPQMISRQAYYLIYERNMQKEENDGNSNNARQEQAQLNDKFWSFFCKQIQKNIEQQRILTLQSLSLLGNRISKQTWNKFRLISLIQKLFQKFKTRQSEIHDKTPTEGLLKKLIRITKAMKSLISNQKIDLSTIIIPIYNQLNTYLITHPRLTTNSKKLTLLNQQYVKLILQNLKFIYRRRQTYNSLRKQLQNYKQITYNISQYQNKQMNDLLLEIYRVMMLRDDQHQDFGQIKGMYEQTKGKLSGNNNNGNFNGNTTDKGRQNYQACQRIIKAVTENTENIFKKQYIQYFFSEQNKKNDKIQFIDQELLQNLKNLLNPPYQYGLNFLQPHLKLIQSAQFSNILVQIFNNCTQLMQQDKQNKKKSLEQVQQSIVNCIWGHGLKINSQFYKMINANARGLKVCLKTKGIGIEGVTIVCQKFFQYADHIPLCANILHINISSNKEWNIVLDKKIPELVNKIYKQKGKIEAYGLSLANLIGSSSKLKSIQNQYKVQQQLFTNLNQYSKNVPCLAATLYAISGLVYLNDSNQKILATLQHIKFYLKIIEQNNASNQIFDKGCNLLSNLVYKNTSLVAIYLKLGVEKSIIHIASSLLYEYISYKQFLRLIGNLSLSLQAANSIVKTQFLYLWGNVLRQAENNKNQDVIKYSFDIIFNLLNYHEVDSKSIAYKINQANCGKRIIQYLQRSCLNSSIVQSGLQALQKILILQVSRKQALQDGLLKSLQIIAKTQSRNQNIFQKWVKVVFVLTKQAQMVKKNILKSEVFGSLALFIRQNPEVKQQYLNLIIVMIDFVYHKGEPSLFISSGFIDLLVQVMKIKHLKTLNATTIIDYFNNLHQKKLLDQNSYIKVFSALMARLELQFRDESSKKIINSITKIRDHIVINTRAATVLLQFGCIFMTQSQAMTSQKYKKRVREFICLLSYFISFSSQLKTIFRGEGFMQILKSWIRIDKSLDEQNQVLQACRMCLFAIQNQQRLFVNVSDLARQNKQKYIQKLLAPTRCLLYRLDHSNKTAIIQIRKRSSNPTDQLQYELISYKAPDGQIKQKYTVPLSEIISIRIYQTQQDQLFKQGIFGKSKTIFQKDACAANCVTIFGVVGEQLSIRQFNVEFQSNQSREEFMSVLKVLISMEVKNKATFIE